MNDMPDGKQYLLREAIEHVKNCASWPQLTTPLQEALVNEYIRKRLACPPRNLKSEPSPDS